MERKALKTEFPVVGSVESLVNIVEEAVHENGFYLEPFWASENLSSHKSFQIKISGSKFEQPYCCGGIEFVQKRRNEVIVRFDSTKGTLRSQAINGLPLERFVFLVLNRFRELDLFVKRRSHARRTGKLNNKY